MLLIVIRNITYTRINIFGSLYAVVINKQRLCQLQAAERVNCMIQIAVHYFGTIGITVLKQIEKFL